MTETHGPVSRRRDLRQHPAFQAAAVLFGGSWALVQVADIFVPNPAVVRWLGIIQLSRAAASVENCHA